MELVKYALSAIILAFFLYNFAVRTVRVIEDVKRRGDDGPTIAVAMLGPLAVVVLGPLIIWLLYLIFR